MMSSVIVGGWGSLVLAVTPAGYVSSASGRAAAPPTKRLHENLLRRPVTGVEVGYRAR